jgi:hypothetical protein
MNLYIDKICVNEYCKQRDVGDIDERSPKLGSENNPIILHIHLREEWKFFI